MNIESYSYLWAASNESSYVVKVDQKLWHLSIELSAERKKKLQQVSLLRRLLPELSTLSTGEVHDIFKNIASYKSRESFGNIEMHQISTKLKAHALEVDAILDDQSSYLIMASSESALLIEDEALSTLVAKKMISAGKRIEEIHAD